MNKQIKNLMRHSLALLPDKHFCTITYFLRHKRFPLLKNPKLFNDKLLYLKLTNRNPLLKKLADKYEVRNYVKERIGEKYLVPLIGVYSSPEEIDFDSLPNQFALKPTASSQYNLICTDKQSLNWVKTCEDIKKWIKLDYHSITREWQYKDLPQRFVIEEYIADKNGNTYDYKFWCFNGNPMFVQVDVDRFTEHKRDIFDINFNKSDLNIVYENSHRQIEKPNNYDLMVDIAKTLSKGFPFIRVDLYNIDGKIYFGELTFYPENCNGKIKPANYEKVLGDMVAI